MSQLINLFPLTVYAADVGFSDEERKKLSDLVQRDAQSDQPITKSEDTSWTGDVNDHAFLHKRKEFGNLFREMDRHLRLYMEQMGIDPSFFDFYFTRSWGTVSKGEEHIAYHKHMQSHLSVVYYPKVPEGSGALVCNMEELPNEFIPGLIREQHAEAGILKGADQMAQNMNIWVKDDVLLIFPSKTRHATEPNMTTETRISIAADVICILKDPKGREFCLPPIKEWRKF
jgi:uncharacterized protein (TIGR02466 family)